MVRVNEWQVLRIGEPLCGVLAAVLALAGAVAAATHSEVLSVRLGIFAAVAAVVSVVLNRRSAALAQRRRLDPIQRAGLLADLREAPILPITVSAPHGDEEAIEFATELLGVLREAEWQAEGVRRDNVAGNVSNAGVTVAVSTGDESPPNEAIWLLRALERIGLAPNQGTSGRLRDHRSLELFVGRRL